MGDFGSPAFTPSQRATLPVDNPTVSFWRSTFPNSIVNERTTPDLPADADVVVVGSGITAAFAVRELLERSKDVKEGLRVVVLEARGTCSGATGRNGGHCQPIIHEATPNVIDFELQDFRRIEQLIIDNHIECDWRRLQGCMGFWNKQYFDESKEELAEQRRVDPRHSKLVSVVEDADSLHDLRLKGAEGAIVQTTAATLSPYKLIIWLWKDMLARYSKGSLNLQTTTPVTAIEPAGSGTGYVCQTPRGAILAKHVLLAANGYTSAILPEFEGLIRPVQGQMSALGPPVSFSGRLLDHSYSFLGSNKKDRVMSDYLHQTPAKFGGHLMFGGARECVVNHGEGTSDDSYVDPDAEDYLRCLPQMLNLSNETRSEQSTLKDKLDISASWTGIMGYSKDHFPWVGGVPHHEGLWLCGGYTGHGMTNASGCGQHVARLLLNAIQEHSWQDRETRAIENHEIPEEYVLTEARFRRQMAHHII